MKRPCDYYGCTKYAVNGYCYEHSSLREPGAGGLLVLTAGIAIGTLLGLVLAAIFG